MLIEVCDPLRGIIDQYTLLQCLVNIHFRSSKPIDDMHSQPQRAGRLFGHGEDPGLLAHASFE
jgi:hypothetical protein